MDIIEICKHTPNPLPVSVLTLEQHAQGSDDSDLYDDTWAIRALSGTVGASCCYTDRATEQALKAFSLLMVPAATIGSGDTQWAGPNV